MYINIYINENKNVRPICYEYENIKVKKNVIKPLLIFVIPT